MNLDSYRNQVVMITGAASGFGALLAERLAGLGAHLVLGDRNVTGLERVAGTVREAGATVLAVPCDVTREVQVKALVDAAMATFGRLDVGVNNAGILTPMKRFVDTTEEELDRSHAVNTKGVFFCMQQQLRQMLPQGGGVILNIASMAGLGGAPKLAAYAAAKHAVVGLTRTAAVEYARRGIRVNALCPFYSATPMVTGSDVGEEQAFLAQGSPMKRLGTPDEIVAAMLMLCARENSYMTGQAIAVDGGISAF
ncbi:MULTISPECIES: glucose 1-dehydrogenase [Pseudomonas]|uniref:SDR family NAD(P)-dependent oxidoreductase n=1 Tax=Pseudomonas TaxID=286 RepID=UPI0018D82857|nr:MULTISPECIES: glucose 1-dehydrogenase [Pseudomonas]MBH3472523.1 SDR family oxidoreductase [Pseudomonas putida]MBP2084226.1 NAD(P)-dependent dehydrogenase (short-subunit alcohol dehydrogenase family) [Pseudomonas sp. PvP089]MBP2090072.1 NAD(P)-dependent dehydrogenase (short-subunit alcohol dehydrogenase family) [Pseudomonas sp. PvP088]MBP2223764.1 NAD(P)-dependent dehydrogenase (short-subunit alcohol dehydrogenase family) [Pseudomonas putida]MCE0967921.1 SDR family oxidoreductase [Pseudomona